MRQWSSACVLVVALTTPPAAVRADEESVSSALREAPSAQKIDLRIPPITSIYTPEQIAAFLARTRDAEMDEVEVEGRREPLAPVTPKVWGGIAAPLWAVLNPSEAWRIFAPLPPDQLRTGPPRSVRANAHYIEPAARTARDL